MGCVDRVSVRGVIVIALCPRGAIVFTHSPHLSYTSHYPSAQPTAIA